MRAVVIVDQELVIEERPDPTPGPTEVTVEVRSAGVNAADLLQRRGFYPAPLGAPADIPGLEIAGEIIEVGSDVTGWTLGNRVMGVVAGGGQAERCVLDASNLLAIPDSINDSEAGGFAEAFVTAYDAIVTRGGLVAGDRLLVTGAAGGVGTAAVQLGAALGADVVASVRSAERRPAVQALGATLAIDPVEVQDHGPYDVVLELVGAASLTSGVLSSLATEARVVVIGVGGGSLVEVDLLGLMGARASIGGATLRPRTVAEKAAIIERVGVDVLPLLSQGAIKIPLLASFPLEQATEAYARFAQGDKLGKIVLVP